MSGTQAVDRAAQLVSSVVAADEPLSFAALQEAMQDQGGSGGGGQPPSGQSTP